MEKWMEEYNALISRNTKAEEYLNSCTQEEFDKWLPEFNKLTRQLSEAINKHKIPEDKILSGF